MQDYFSHSSLIVILNTGELMRFLYKAKHLGMLERDVCVPFFLRCLRPLQIVLPSKSWRRWGLVPSLLTVIGVLSPLCFSCFLQQLLPPAYIACFGEGKRREKQSFRPPATSPDAQSVKWFVRRLISKWRHRYSSHHSMYDIRWIASLGSPCFTDQ